MLKAQFVSDYVQENIDDVKIAALYYDQIDIKTCTLDLSQYSDHPDESFIITYAEDTFKDNIQLLIQEGLVNYVDKDPNNDKFFNLFSKPELFFNLDDTDTMFGSEVTFHLSAEERIKLSPEEQAELQIMIDALGFEERSPFQRNYRDIHIREYYDRMFYSLFQSLNSDHQTITSSKILNNGLNRYFNSDYFKEKMKHLSHEQKAVSSFSLAFEAIKIAIPNVSMLAIEDILEIRYKLKDELEFFRNQMEKTQSEISTNFEYKNNESQLQSIVQSNINLPLIELNRKIKGANINVLSKLLTELKNPWAYAPLIGTFIEGLPKYAAGLASLAVIGGNTFFEAVQQNNEIKNNGLYYLVKLNKKYNRKNGIKNLTR